MGYFADQPDMLIGPNKTDRKRLELLLLTTAISRIFEWWNRKSVEYSRFQNISQNHELMDCLIFSARLF